MVVLIVGSLKLSKYSYVTVNSICGDVLRILILDDLSICPYKVA